MLRFAWSRRNKYGTILHLSRKPPTACGARGKIIHPERQHHPLRPRLSKRSLSMKPSMASISGFNFLACARYALRWRSAGCTSKITANMALLRSRNVRLLMRPEGTRSTRALANKAAAPSGSQTKCNPLIQVLASAVAAEMALPRTQGACFTTMESADWQREGYARC
jgi:hypothetical protein